VIAKRVPNYLIRLMASALVLGIALSFFDKGGFSLSGVIAYFIVSAFAAIVLRFGWRSVSKLSPPSWLQTALIVAIGIRLVVGVGLFASLPVFGYQDSKPHLTGYIYRDAYERDKDAWRFAISDAPLISAWTDSDLSDQYGGLHFISVSIYRVISPDMHRPLLVILLTAAFGALVVLFTWSSSKREAVLLSASQMREPFLIAALAIGLDGYSRVRSEETKVGIIHIVIAVLIALILSPPFSLVLIGLLAIAWVWEGRVHGRQKIWATLSILALGLAGILLTIRGWANIPGSPGGNAYR